MGTNAPDVFEGSEGSAVGIFQPTKGGSFARKTGILEMCTVLLLTAFGTSHDESPVTTSHGGTIQRAPTAVLGGVVVILIWLSAIVPLPIALRFLLDALPLVVFITGGMAIAVLAEQMRRATEQIALRIGPGVGGLLNVSFGSIAESY